jgi:UDP-N-acetylmuramate dehydrogenase
VAFATLSVGEKREKGEVIKMGKEALSKRTVSLEMGPSAGSVFKNPEGLYAGKLIEESGLKGKIMGEAIISNRHANVIVNLKGASRSDVFALISLCQRKVFKDHGADLVLEIRIMNRWGEI